MALCRNAARVVGDELPQPLPRHGRANSLSQKHRFLVNRPVPSAQMIDIRHPPYPGPGLLHVPGRKTNTGPATGKC